MVGITTSREVWNTLEQRFTSTSRANILNLKLELQSLKKGSDSVNNFLQKIKIACDKLLAVKVVVDNEELICIVLRGLPKDFLTFVQQFVLGVNQLPMNNFQLCCKVKNKPWQRILIVFHTLWPCLLLEIRILPALILSHITMVVLIEEEERTVVIEVEVEEDSTTIMVEVNTFFNSQPQQSYISP